MGNILTRHAIHKIKLSEKGKSTLGGLKRWFDPEVNRLKDDGNGKFLGEFKSDDKILAINDNGTYRTVDFDLTNHFDDDVKIVEKFDESKVFSVVYYDADVEFYYLKRFVFEPSIEKQSIIGDNPNSKLIVITSEKYPQLEVSFKGKHKDRPEETVDVEEFIAVKGYKAKGKRVTIFTVKEIIEIEPKKVEEEMPEINNNDNDDEDTDDSGQMELNL
jgi:topoisomerase-4 subunit A